MTRRDYLEAKVAKREEWAAGRRAKAAGLLKQNEPFRGDIAFNTQPGHIPERARVIARSEKAYEHTQMAAHHVGKAAGLAQQLETTIFSDDPDALEALAAKIAGLEAEREQMKKANAAFRKGGRAGLATVCGDAVAAAFDRLKALCPYEKQPYPAYALSNLGGNIGRLKKRIEDVKRRQAQTAEAEAAPGGVVIKGAADYVNVTFAEKPERAVLDALKAAGFVWSGGAWCGYRAKVPEVVQQMVQQQDVGETKEVQDDP